MVTAGVAEEGATLSHGELEPRGQSVFRAAEEHLLGPIRNRLFGSLIVGDVLGLDKRTSEMANQFTEKQGQYLAFIYNYTVMFGQPPAEADLQRFFGSSPPTIHQMVVKLAERQLISRTPGQPRSIRLLVSPDEIPRLVPPRTSRG